MVGDARPVLVMTSNHPLRIAYKKELVSGLYKNGFEANDPPALHGLNGANDSNPLKIFLDPDRVIIDLERRTRLYAELCDQTGVPGFVGLGIMPNPRPKGLQLPKSFANIWYNPELGWSIYLKSNTSHPAKLVDMVERDSILIEENDHLLIRTRGQPGLFKDNGLLLGPALAEKHESKQVQLKPDEYLRLDFSLRHRNHSH